MTKATRYLIIPICLLIVAPPMAWAASEKGTKRCSNGIDDDLDGAIDCEDSGCASQDICNGGGGDDGGGGTVARVTLRANGFPGAFGADRFRDDGVTICAEDGSHYWDQTDSACGDTGLAKSNLSGGGRLHFNSNNGPEQLYPDPPLVNRWGVFDWTDTVDGSTCPNLDQVLYGGVDPYPSAFPPIDPDPCIDNLEFRLGADRMFKAKATRQQLTIVLPGPSVPDENGDFVFGVGYILEFVNPVYLVDTADPDVRLLTTTNPDTGVDDVALAELWFNTPTPPIFIGTFEIAFEISVERFEP